MCATRLHPPSVITYASRLHTKPAAWIKQKRRTVVVWGVVREFRLWRIFARSTPDKRACRSPSGECEPYASLCSTQSFVRRLKPSFCRKPCLLQNHKTSVRLLCKCCDRLTSGARQKQKTTPIGVEGECVREFRLWRIFLLAAHVSKLTSRPNHAQRGCNPTKSSM